MPLPRLIVLLAAIGCSLALVGIAGAATINCTGSPFCNGTSSADTIYGSNNDETISALGGGDLVYPRLDGDTIYGGAGNDTIWASDDEVQDTVFCGSGAYDWVWLDWFDLVSGDCETQREAD